MRLAGLPEGNGRDMVWISRGWRALVNSRDANLGLCLGLGLRTNAPLRVRTVADFPTRRGRLRARVRTARNPLLRSLPRVSEATLATRAVHQPARRELSHPRQLARPRLAGHRLAPSWSLRRAGNEESAETLAWFPRKRSPRGVAEYFEPRSSARTWAPTISPGPPPSHPTGWWTASDARGERSRAQESAPDERGALLVSLGPTVL